MVPIRLDIRFAKTGCQTFIVAVIAPLLVGVKAPEHSICTKECSGYFLLVCLIRGSRDVLHVVRLVANL